MSAANRPLAIAQVFNATMEVDEDVIASEATYPPKPYGEGGSNPESVRGV
jgi:hypothetical protein